MRDFGAANKLASLANRSNVDDKNDNKGADQKRCNDRLSMVSVFDHPTSEIICASAKVK